MPNRLKPIFACVYLFPFLLANESLKKLKLSKKSQSIVITGITGSGKTETGKHVIEFLCNTPGVENILKANPVLETFGNARTHANINSSRFCKLTEVMWIEKTHIVCLI